MPGFKNWMFFSNLKWDFLWENKHFYADLILAQNKIPSKIPLSVTTQKNNNTGYDHKWTFYWFGNFYKKSCTCPYKICVDVLCLVKGSLQSFSWGVTIQSFEDFFKVLKDNTDEFIAFDDNLHELVSHSGHQIGSKHFCIWLHSHNYHHFHLPPCRIFYGKFEDIIPLIWGIWWLILWS